MIVTQGKVDSRFLLGFKPLQQYDNQSVVFGQVVDGLDYLRDLANNSSQTGLPGEDIVITACEEMPLDGLTIEQKQKREQTIMVLVFIVFPLSICVTCIVCITISIFIIR